MFRRRFCFPVAMAISLSSWAGSLSIGVFAPAEADGQLISFDMDNPSEWNVVGDPDTAVDFGFDYDSFGIPPAPNGSGTTGIRLRVNMTDPAAIAAVSVTPAGLHLAGNYRLEVDFWLNYYADLDNVGTTEFAGVFVGFDPNDGPINGVGIIGSTDGDAAEDIRMYAGSTSHLTIDSEQYFLSTLDNSDPDLSSTFPEQVVPVEQLDEFDPPNQDVLTRAGALAFAWHTLSVEVDADVGSALFAIDDLELGYVEADLNGVNLAGGVALTMWDLFASVAPVGEFAFVIFDDLRIAVVDTMVLGDFDGDSLLTAADIDLLAAEIQAGGSAAIFDVDGNGDVDMADHSFWVNQLKGTYLGDANLDGEFSSADFVVAFQQGEYEDGVPNNSGWADGDWNADGDFDSSDFVAAFQQGGYENGPRAAMAVPEPNSMLVVLGAWAALSPRQRRRATPVGRPC